MSDDKGKNKKKGKGNNKGNKGKSFPLPPPPLFSMPSMTSLQDEVTHSPPSAPTAPLVLNPIMETSPLDSPSSDPTAPLTAVAQAPSETITNSAPTDSSTHSRINETFAELNDSPAPGPTAPLILSSLPSENAPPPPAVAPPPSITPAPAASANSLLALSQQQRLSPPNLNVSGNRRLSPPPNLNVSNSRRTSAHNSPTGAYSSVSRRSSEHSTASFDSRHVLGSAPPLPPIQGSFSSASFSQLGNRQSFATYQQNLPESFWDEPDSNADAYDDRQYSFSPVITDARSRTMSVDTLTHSNVNEANDMVELDLDGFLRSEHGSVRSVNTRGIGRYSKDGLMRQVQNSLVTSREMKLRKGAVWCATILLVALTVGLSVALSAGRAAPGEPSPATLLPPTSHGAPTHVTPTTTFLAPNHCDFSKTPFPDPFLECDCLHGIFTYEPKVWLTYVNLRDTWLVKLFPNFQEKSESCHPHNVALAWLSADAQRATLTEAEYTDRFLLAVVFAELKGITWKDKGKWLTSSSVCEWFGVQCDSRSRITGLKLNENNLTGRLPSELALIVTLASLNLSYNHLSGSIPSEFGTIRNLQELTLSVNFLKGTIPSTIGDLGDLRTLQLDFNLISGSMPSTFGKLLFLQRLSLWDNQLVGKIPTNIGTMFALEQMKFHNNKITGTIPTEIGLSTSLKVFDAAGNQLKGTIPTEFGLISPLESLDLGKNGLEGSIPTELAKCTNLGTMGLSNNLMKGTIPTRLGALTKLQFLFLSSNKLSGTIPSELGKLTHLEVLQLQTNRFVGVVPSNLGKLGALKTLNLSDNYNFNSPIAKPICDLREAGALTTFIASCVTCKVPSCCTQCA